MQEESTLQPFAPGDVFLGCTLLDDSEDDHKGKGRILQFDSDLNPKGMLWTEGTNHLVISLTFDPQGTLWGFDTHNHVVVRVDTSGRQLPNHHFGDRGFGNAVFDSQGNIYLGEYLQGTTPYPKSFFKRLPGSDSVGDGNIHKFNQDFELVKTFEVENAQEFTPVDPGFKAVTHTTMSPDEQHIAYTTETGKRIMRYDIVNDCQLPDLMTCPGEMDDRNWVIAVQYLSDGRMLVTRGASFDILDQTGDLIRNYDISKYGYGFASITPCRDGQHILTSNVFTGVMVKVNLESGDVTGEIDTGMSEHRSLAGLAEFVG